MNDTSKIIRDPIHGDIKVTGLLLSLVQTPELQRLQHIRQLGFAQLVFPGAHHTRFEHSLGAAAIMAQVADVLHLKHDDRQILTAAALLHDIGHGPFSHTLEALLLEQFGVDHVGLTLQLLKGKYDVFEDRERPFLSSRVCEVLKDEGINVRTVGQVIEGRTTRRPFLGQLLSSTIDVDQLDYLMRDAYYTGVAYGMIDLQRLLQTLTVHAGTLMVKRKGVSVVENILMARGLMYSSVYFHKTVRIAELMLSRALETVPVGEPFEFFRMTDAEIIATLQDKGTYQQEVMTRLKYRSLFKQAYAASFGDLSKERLTLLRSFEDASKRRSKERELEEALKVPSGHLLLDVPRQELLRTEPRINLTDIQVDDNGKGRSLDAFTPIASAIRSRLAPDWAVMVITDEKHRSLVAKRVERYLFA